MGILHYKATSSDIIWGFALLVTIAATAGTISLMDAPVYPAFFWSVLVASLIGITMSAFASEPFAKPLEDHGDRISLQANASSNPAPTGDAALLGSLFAGAPILLSEPRTGGADPLHRMDGIDTELEALLNAQGVFHFDQIAAWGRTQVAWIEDHLEGTSGRVTRDRWVAQAKSFRQPRKAKVDKPRGS